MNEQLKQQITEAMEELLKISKLQDGDIFLIGCSTSEVLG